MNPMNSPAGQSTRPSVSANDAKAGRSGITPETFGEEVRRRRESAGMTQSELASLAGVSGNVVYRLETGRGGSPVKAKTVDRVRSALDRAESPGPGCTCVADVDELAVELAEERIAHQQTLATLRAIRALLDSHGGLQ